MLCNEDKKENKKETKSNATSILSSIHSRAHIFMLYVAEQSEFPVGPFGMNEGLERSIQFLDCHLLLGLLVSGRAEQEHAQESQQ